MEMEYSILEYNDSNKNKLPLLIILYNKKNNKIFFKDLNNMKNLNKIDTDCISISIESIKSEIINLNKNNKFNFKEYIEDYKDCLKFTKIIKLELNFN